MFNTANEFLDTWLNVSRLWKKAGTERDPLSAPGPAVAAAEGRLTKLVVKLLNSSGEEAERLFASARRIRDAQVGAKIDLRAVVDLSNKCRVNCGFCPMRRDHSHALPPAKAGVQDIVDASESAYRQGFRQFFLQSGEDPTIVRPVLAALERMTAEHDDWDIVLNFGNHKSETYAALKAAGAHGYLIKHETANAQFHLSMRGESLERRVEHMLAAREAGLYIGSGIILGLPGHTDEDIARDLVFLGRINSSRMASCSPFTTSPDLPAEFQMTPPGVFDKTLRFIALLRHAFPNARIPATSNLDSPKLAKAADQSQKSGQAMAIDAGANGITVQFTPAEIENSYGLYARGSEKSEQGYLVRFAKALLVSEQTGLPLDLIAESGDDAHEAPGQPYFAARGFTQDRSL